MATKRFDIGEYVVGGSIRVNVTSKKVEVKFCDYKTENTLVSMEVTTQSDSAESDLQNFIESNGTSYYAEKVMEYIKKNTKFAKKSFW